MASGVGMGGWGLLWWLVMLALVVGIVVAAVVLLRREADTDTDGAVAVLRERYAAGDIDEEEFERRQRRLSGEQTS
jgi:putative membrane protein